MTFQAQLAAEAQKLENRVQELENENKLLKETLIQHSIALPIALEHEEESGSEKGEASDVEAKEAISAEDSVHSSDDVSVYFQLWALFFLSFFCYLIYLGDLVAR